MYKNKEKMSLLMALVFCLCLCMAIPVSADTTAEAIAYLDNWSYTDGDTVYTINVNAMTDEELAPYIAANPSEWDSMILTQLGLAFDQLANTITPYTIHRYETDEVQYVDFTFNNSVYTREYTWTMTADITSSDGEVISIGNTTCNIYCGANLSANNLTKVFAVNCTRYATVGYNVEFIATIATYFTASNYESLVHNFYV